MSEVVLRIAQAMAAAVTGPMPWEKMPVDSKAIYLRDARLALAAIREPTEAMIEAGYVLIQDVDIASHMALEEAWRAMVDEALR